MINRPSLPAARYLHVPPSHDARSATPSDDATPAVCTSPPSDDASGSDLFRLNAALPARSIPWTPTSAPMWQIGLVGRVRGAHTGPPAPCPRGCTATSRTLRWRSPLLAILQPMDGWMWGMGSRDGLMDADMAHTDMAHTAPQPLHVDSRSWLRSWLLNHARTGILRHRRHRAQWRYTEAQAPGRATCGTV